MTTDVLILAGITFDAFSTPRRLPFGGNQAMVVHKLPGGSRVIDTLGPDEADIAWECQFYGDDAFARVQAIDALRAAGQLVPLTFNGQARQVVIAQFLPINRRFPNWFEYSIVCTVASNPMLGNLMPDTSTMDDLVGDDLSSASTASLGTPADTGGLAP